MRPGLSTCFKRTQDPTRAAGLNLGPRVEYRVYPYGLARKTVLKRVANFEKALSQNVFAKLDDL